MARLTFSKLTMDVFQSAQWMLSFSKPSSGWEIHWESSCGCWCSWERVPAWWGQQWWRLPLEIISKKKDASPGWSQSSSFQPKSDREGRQPYLPTCWQPGGRGSTWPPRGNPERKVVVEQNADISRNRSTAQLCSQYVLTKGDLRCRKSRHYGHFLMPLASSSPQDLWTLSLKEVFYR